MNDVFIYSKDITPTPEQVEDLGQLVTPFGQGLRALALTHLAITCAHFGQDQICTQVDASFSPFGHPTQVNAS